MSILNDPVLLEAPNIVDPMFNLNIFIEIMYSESTFKYTYPRMSSNYS